MATEPMTAAEYRGTFVGMSPLTRRILAALEDREANLENARIGALLVQIRDHRVNREVFAPRLEVRLPAGGCYWSLLHEEHLGEAVAHLDSLLPKEPEVAPSGWTYERVSVRNGQPCIVQCREGGVELTCFGGHDDVIPPIDREFVHKLMEASRGV